MSEGQQPIALVTGANRGIGFEVCRQLAERDFVVLLTARDSTKARTAARKLGNVGTVEPLGLDVADAPSIQKRRSRSSEPIRLPRCADPPISDRRTTACVENPSQLVHLPTEFLG